MTLPTIHLNGTSSKTLEEDYEKAYRAIHAAMDSFGAIEFNGRDYYPQGPDAFKAATKARSEMMGKMNDVAQYIVQHLEHIADYTELKNSMSSSNETRV